MGNVAAVPGPSGFSDDGECCFLLHALSFRDLSLGVTAPVLVVVSTMATFAVQQLRH
jgi:hypothetical protein